jgi:hypothetical protein
MEAPATTASKATVACHTVIGAGPLMTTVVAKITRIRSPIINGHFPSCGAMLLLIPLKIFLHFKRAP